MTTTLSPSFLRAVVLVTGFKHRPMVQAQAAMLMIALEYGEVTGNQIPKDIIGDSKNLSGCAAGALVAQGLLEVMRREKSPDPRAKGRRLDVFRITKTETAKTWLRANGFDVPENATRQLELA